MLTEIIDWHPVAVAAVMMALDIATGFAGAAKGKAVESGRCARFFGTRPASSASSAWPPCGRSGACDFNLETAQIGVTVPELPAVGTVCTFVVATEIVSILESLCVLNPDIASMPVVRHLKPHDPEAPDAAIEIDDDELAQRGA